MGGNRTGAVQHRGLGEIDIIGSAALMHNAARRPLSRNGHRLTARRRGIPVTPRKQNQAAGPVDLRQGAAPDVAIGSILNSGAVYYDGENHAAQN